MNQHSLGSLGFIMHSLGSLGFIIHSMHTSLLAWGPQNALQRCQSLRWHSAAWWTRCFISRLLPRLSWTVPSQETQPRACCGSAHTERIDTTWWPCLQFESIWVWGEKPRWQNWVETVCCQPTSHVLVSYSLFTQGNARATVLHNLCTNLNDKESEKQWNIMFQKSWGVR